MLIFTHLSHLVNRASEKPNDRFPLGYISLDKRAEFENKRKEKEKTRKSRFPFLSLRVYERKREKERDSIYELNSSGLGFSCLETSAATNVGLRLTFPFRARICLKYRLCRPGIRHRGRINGCNRSLKSAVAILDENRESRSYATRCIVRSNDRLVFDACPRFMRG